MYPKLSPPRRSRSGRGPRLENGSRVAVIGGGPAGTFFSYFLLRTAEQIGLEIELDLYEPRDFCRPGPGSCNMCGGVVSESLLQRLATEGIHLPPEIIQRRIESYYLHMDVGSVRIESPVREKRIAAVHRGAGPRDLALGGEASLDGYLLGRAERRGARRLAERVAGLDMADGRPRIRTRSGSAASYDLVAAATGVNTSALGMLETNGHRYRRPQTARTYICEVELSRDLIRRYLGSSMHVFLLDIPRLEFAAIIPKSTYATVCLLGRDIDKAMIDSFFAAPEVKRCLPPHWRLPERACHCSPRINVGTALEPFADRLVLVGDCAVTRLYKDGIGSAYRTAKAAATTAACSGISAEAFARHYWPACRAIERDNRLGRMVFALTRQLQRHAVARRSVWRVVSKEQQSSSNGRLLSQMLWDTFTGSAPYRTVLQRAVRPSLFSSLFREATRSTARPAPRSDRKRRPAMSDSTFGHLGRKYRDGDLIFREGELGGSMYVIQAGEVELLQRDDDKEFCLAVLGPGDFFGEMALFEHEFRTTAARASGDTWVVTLDRRALLRFINEDPSLAFRVMQKMSHRIRELEASLVRLGAERTLRLHRLDRREEAG